MMGPTRRSVIAGLAAGALAAPALAQASPSVVVIGGGFAGATCARSLHRAGVKVTLVEAQATYISCPFSNGVLAGLRELKDQSFTYDALSAEGIAIARQSATAIDREGRRVTLADGAVLPYDRLVLAPGIDVLFDALPGYNAAAAEIMPHAWKAGPQTTLLRRQLEAMEDGGTVIISAPANPFRCPPGPYERASLIAYYLKTKKPRSKLLILDAKDTFSKQGLFTAGWKELYGDMVEWVGLSAGGKVTEIQPDSKTFVTEFGSHRADVGNVIPPQRAGRIAVDSGIADQTGWCPIDPVTFEARAQTGIHVIGDAAIAGGMPKSAFAANAQAKACAQAIVLLLRGQVAPEPKLINTCYSLVAPDYGISVAGVYAPAKGLLTDVPGAGGVSPAKAPSSVRAAEATYADAWFKTITSEVFG
ncbi:MAG: cytochrome [Hyphomicrobiales bacterium]|nr:cytochrome [Hyphomicrobiales bacterium]